MSVKYYKVLCYSFFTNFIKKKIYLYVLRKLWLLVSEKSCIQPKNWFATLLVEFFLIYLYTNRTSLILYYFFHLLIFYDFFSYTCYSTIINLRSPNIHANKSVFSWYTSHSVIFFNTIRYLLYPCKLFRTFFCNSIFRKLLFSPVFLHRLSVFSNISL